jgi:hypothetical protein
MNGSHPATRTVGRLVLTLLAAACVGAASPGTAAAQDPGTAASSEPPSVRVYVGLWTTHFRDIGKGLRQNWLLGVNYRGFYGGTFVNSFGGRSFTAGIQRTVARGADGTVVPRAGYRLGLVTGYDERFWSLAGKTPVLPFPQILGGVDSGITGIELGIAPLVATLGPNLFF